MNVPGHNVLGEMRSCEISRDPKEKENMRVDMALQGPLSKQILLKAGFNADDIKKIDDLKRTQLCHADWQGLDLIISRTGYTGEKMAFEIFIHPDAAVTILGKADRSWRTSWVNTLRTWMHGIPANRSGFATLWP